MSHDIMIFKADLAILDSQLMGLKNRATDLLDDIDDLSATVLSMQERIDLMTTTA